MNTITGTVEKIGNDAGKGVSLCRDCWKCECAVPVAWVVRDGITTFCQVPKECPYCGATDPLGDPKPSEHVQANEKMGMSIGEKAAMVAKEWEPFNGPVNVVALHALRSAYSQGFMRGFNYCTSLPPSPIVHPPEHVPAEDASAERQALVDVIKENEKLRALVGGLAYYLRKYCDLDVYNPKVEKLLEQAKEAGLL